MTQRLRSSNSILTPLGSFGQDAADSLLAGAFNIISASGAIDPHTPAKYVITKAGVAALTLAAPTAVADDGVRIEFISTTAQAHTVTTPAAGDIRDGNSSDHDTVATFAAHIGANFCIEAYNGVWYVTDETAVTLTS